MSKRIQPKGLSDKFLDRSDPGLKAFLSDISRYNPLPPNKQNALIVEAQNGDISARQEVGKCNCRLIIRIARKFQSENFDIRDLIQEGYLGLDEAISRFDVKRKVPFASFAAWWIKMKIMKYIWWYQTAVILPEVQKVAINKLLKISTKFVKEHTRLPSEEELLELSGLSEQKVKNYVNLFNCGNLLKSQAIDNLEDESVIITERSPSTEEIVDKKITVEAISNCLDTLPMKHQEFLRDYYGIGRPAVSPHEMARRRNNSTENIRLIRVKLIKYLKENCTKDLAPYAE
nr:MAG TPA: DNA directed RNA polymerase subunit [Caudoviricetes sp.]